MKWEKLTERDYVTTKWSGGTTTQLAIAPEGAVYADRNFLWRLSSARVEDEHSTFTPLPDYNRLISVREGELKMKVGSAEAENLDILQVLPFDGAVPVESWGKCTDFNLMLRKGRCSGLLQTFVLEGGSSLAFSFPVPENSAGAERTLALFCAEGELLLEKDGVRAASGEMLLSRDAENTPVDLSAKGSTAVIAAVIFTRNA